MTVEDWAGGRSCARVFGCRASEWPFQRRNDPKGLVESHSLRGSRKQRPNERVFVGRTTESGIDDEQRTNGPPREEVGVAVVVVAAHALRIDTDTKKVRVCVNDEKENRKDLDKTAACLPDRPTQRRLPASPFEVALAFVPLAEHLRNIGFLREGYRRGTKLISFSSRKV